MANSTFFDDHSADASAWRKPTGSCGFGYRASGRSGARRSSSSDLRRSSRGTGRPSDAFGPGKAVTGAVDRPSHPMSAPSSARCHRPTRFMWSRKLCGEPSPSSPHAV